VSRNLLPVADPGNILLSVAQHLRCQPFGRGPLDRLLAGCIDIGQHQHVGIVECGDELVEQFMGPAVAVGLESGYDPPLRPPLAGGGKGGPDFGRMVAVVVNDHDPFRFPLDGEASADAAEFGKPFLDRGEGDIQLHGHGNAGHGIEHVVCSRHAEGDLPQAVPLVMGDKGGIEAVMRDMGRTDIGLGGESVGHVALLHLRQYLADVPVVETENRQAVERHLVDEFDKGLPDLLDAGVEIQVVGIDIGHHGNGGGKNQERAVRFIRLGDEELPLAELGVGADGIQLAADDNGRIYPRVAENGCRHGGGGGLAVCAGNGDAVLHPHQLGQHLRPGDDRYVQPPGLDNLRIVVVDRGGDDHHIHVLQVFRLVADADPCTEAGEPLGDFGGAQIGAGNLVPQIEEHFGDAAHADAADADEVNFLYFPVHV